MSVMITNNAITTSSGKLVFEESDHQIELRTGKIIVTNKFISTDTYVFPRGAVIPIGYILVKKTSGTSTSVTYNLSTGALAQSDSNGTSQLVKTPYADLGINSILGDSSITKTYTLGACQSNVTGSAETTEVNYYVANKGFNASAYSLSARAPTLICNNQAIPYTSNANLKVTLSGNTLTITSTIASYVYICLLVTL